MTTFIYSIILSPLFKEISTIVLAIGLILFIIRRMLIVLRSKYIKNYWLKTLSEVSYIPIFWIILIYGCCLIVEALLVNSPTLASKISQIKSLIIIGGFTYITFHWKSIIFEWLIKKDRNKEVVLFASSKIATIFILINAALMGLNIIGIPLQGLLAFGGIGGIAIGWAAKDIVANFFGGLMIFINRPFVIGNWVKSTNKNFEGTVEHIGWYMTQIRTFERRPMYIPNALMTDAIIENPGRMYNRRIQETIGIRYNDIAKIKDLVPSIKEMLQNHPEIDQKQILMVHFVGFGAHALDINIYAFTKTTQWEQYRNVQQDIFLRIADIIESYKAEIAYPTTIVQVQQLPNG